MTFPFRIALYRTVFAVITSLARFTPYGDVQREQNTNCRCRRLHDLKPSRNLAHPPPSESRPFCHAAKTIELRSDENGRSHEHDSSHAPLAADGPGTRVGALPTDMDPPRLSRQRAPGGRVCQRVLRVAAPLTGTRMPMPSEPILARSLPQDRKFVAPRPDGLSKNAAELLLCWWQVQDSNL